ncbi:MAG: restriction endonuclease subunit S [Desulfobacterales bacterium]|nr:restriction endonuclease subunit S [Desulfobacterales bacterium]
MHNWTSHKLGDVVSSNNNCIGKGYPHQKILYLDTGSITCGKIDSFQKLSLENAPSRAKRLVKNNDIIYSTVRPIQRHYGFIINPLPNLVVSTGFSLIEINKKLADPLYIYNFLISDEIVETLDIIADGSTSVYPSLKPSDIENVEILLPPLPEQKAIASVLSSLDDKIDLLHRQNKTLEAMAETLFRQWFVEEAQDDWEEKHLKEICVINNGYAFKSPTYQDFGQKIIRTLNFSNHWIELDRLVFISQELAKSFEKYYLKRNDFLLVMVGASLGNFAIVTKDVIPALQNQNMWCFRAKKKIKQHYLNFVLRKLIDENLHGASGSARQFFQKSVFYEIEVPIPPLTVMEEFERVAEGYFQKIELNKCQIRTLEKLRDMLLPKLMSGEVRVKI